MNNKWIVSGNEYHMTEVSQEVDKLGSGVYVLEFNEFTKKFFLTKKYEKFNFKYKLYGVEQEFIDRVKRTYENTSGNLGIALNGIKGTGKTVTAEIICNVLNLPVIVINAEFQNLQIYFNNLQEDCILFFDEYEKFYGGYNHSMLSIMDGALNNSSYRKVFLLTTNDMHLNTNMLQRPSRIRYVKTFGDLSLENIELIVDDVLKYTNYRVDVIEYISTLEIITIDIVKAVCEEVNIHNQSPKLFKDVFNVRSSSNVNNVVEIIFGDGGTKENLLYQSVKVIPTKFTSKEIGTDFYVNDKYIGDIKNILSENTIVIEVEKDEKTVDVTYRIDKIDTLHKMFEKYVF